MHRREWDPATTALRLWERHRAARVVGFDRRVRAVELGLDDPEQRHDPGLPPLQRVRVLVERKGNLLLRLLVKLEGRLLQVVGLLDVVEGARGARRSRPQQRSSARRTSQQRGVERPSTGRGAPAKRRAKQHASWKPKNKKKIDLTRVCWPPLGCLFSFFLSYVRECVVFLFRIRFLSFFGRNQIENACRKGMPEGLTD